MTISTYQQIALQWRPESQDNRRFYVIVSIVLAVFLAIAIAFSLVDVPQDEKRKKVNVPDRVAQFIKKQPKVEPPKPKPKPEPKPIPKPKPKVERQKVDDKKPLTKEEKKARAKAEQTGILALAEEFADLIDSSAVDAAVTAQVVSSGSGKEKKAGHSADILTAGAGKGSGGVDSGRYATSVGSTQLSQREIALVQQSLFKEDVEVDESDDAGRERGDNVRSEEEVTIVFDQNKGRLQSIYNRERRTKPGLKGKIVFEITVAPSGNVTSVRVVSSELNDPALERRLIARIKTFVFGSKDVEPVTVTFPIEFLPS
ncbi:AgmX/PglI C-terminal domain-containing protein [Teredinibacter sp. KSP-S5-2]|uniref:AgmX/PglI C-terminal domain-containing protein n=1 Tax=Teredinibacter sp. KSP-S5-2 TaxID=3034506 RepID=UPI002934C0B9|nr:AgmX/PglI C-terminal domain-containing protein [Teredinibacter sp. KSP-S5-2]WNO08056.1 AgmX/PglI C-terminal domain-containing protein [Teredinibacter sp. KSP-S5-2]